MTRDEKIAWMAVWAAKNNVKLVLDGEVGIFRPCVGISSHDCYPDYSWELEEDVWTQEDVWTPPLAYHKHPCVAVLGTGEESEDQLFQWLKWFDDNGYIVEVTDADKSEWEHLGYLGLIMGKHQHVRMVRKK